MTALFPWAAALLFPLLNYQPPAFGPLSLDLGLLCIPLAVWLAGRHGSKGLAVVAVGLCLGYAWVPLITAVLFVQEWNWIGFWHERSGWAWLPVTFSTYAGRLHNDVALSLAALGAAALAWVAAQRPLGELSRRWRVPASAAIAAIAVLPWSALLFQEDWGGGWRVSGRIGGLPLLWGLLFFLGLCRASGRLVLGTLAGVTLTGIVLAWLGLPQPVRQPAGELPLKGTVLALQLQLDTPVRLFAALAWFLVGRAVKQLAWGQRRRGLLRHPAWSLGLLLFLWGGGLLYELLPRSGEAWAVLTKLRLLGGRELLAVAALFAGVAFRFKGLLAVGLAGLLLALLRIGLNVAGWGVRLNFHLDEVLVGAAFAAVGVGLGDWARGVRTAWPSAHWFTYAGLMAITWPLMFDLEAPSTWPGAAVAALAMVLLAGMGWRLHRRSAASAAADVGRGWAALAGLLFFATALLPQLRSALEALAQAGSLLGTAVASLASGQPGGDAWEQVRDDGERLVLAALAFAYAGVFLATLGTFVGQLPALRADARTMAAFVRAARGRERATWTLLATQAAPASAPAAADKAAAAPPVEPDRHGRFHARAVLVLAWGRRAAFGAAALLIGLAMYGTFWAPGGD